MARIRTIKPEMAAHEGLFDLEVETGLPIRFAWCMLFTVADREGRFVWRPRTLKASCLPHDTVDFSRVLDAWLTRAFVVKYRVKGTWFGWIPTFTKHQVINNREAPSDLPPLEEAEDVIDNRNNNIDACGTREPRDDDASATREVHAQAEGRKEGKGKEGKEYARVDHASNEDRSDGDRGVDQGEEPRGEGNDGAKLARTRKTTVEPLQFAELRARYPKRAGSQRWDDAARFYAKRVAEGHTHERIMAGVDAYAAQCVANGKSGTETVMQAATFLGENRCFLEEFPLPAKTNGANGNHANAEASQAWNRVLVHVKTSAYRGSSPSLDPRIDQVVRYIGGYPLIGSKPESELPFFRAKFIKAWAEGAP